MSTLWFKFMQFWYLLASFITRPLQQRVKRRPNLCVPHIRSQDEYEKYRDIARQSSSSHTPWNYYSTFKEWIDIAIVIGIWEEDNYIWWNTVLDMKKCNAVKFYGAPWRIQFSLLRLHVINSIRERITGKYFDENI